MKINEIVESCTRLVEEFSRNDMCNGFDFREDKNLAVWTVYSKLIKIDFVLTKKESIFVPVSTLYSRIFLHTNGEEFLHIPEIIDELDPEDFHCYYFPYIESEEKLENCFGHLRDFYIKHLPALWEIAYDEERREGLYERKKAEYKRVVEIEDDSDEYLDMYNYRVEKHLILTRYTRFDAYTAFLNGNYDKALAVYRKTKKKDALLDYEERLLSFIPECETVYEAVFPGTSDVHKANSYVQGKESDKALIKCWAFLYAVFFVIFTAIVLGIRAYCSRDTLFYADAEALIMSMAFATLPAIFGGMALRRPLIRLLSRKKQKEFLAYDEIANSKGTNKFLNIVFELVLIACLLFTVWFGNMNLACYEDRFVYNDGEKFLSFETETKYYKDITAVYHVDGLYNDYGDWIDRGFYIIVFNDGSTFNTDLCLYEDEARDGFLPVISDYYDEVIYVTTEDEIILE